METETFDTDLEVEEKKREVYSNFRFQYICKIIKI